MDNIFAVARMTVFGVARLIDCKAATLHWLYIKIGK